MNLIYWGKYKRRFKRINALISKDATNVTELCFGDVFIADYCAKRNIKWTGYDLNENFVKHAKKLNHNALEKDITQNDEFSKCDTSIIAGSLYHFKSDSLELVRKMIKSSKQVIISEPVKNLSTAKGITGFIARRSANTGRGNESFRFNKTTFIEMMNKLKVEYKIISIDKDILIEINYE